MSLAFISKENNKQLLKQLEDECNSFEVNSEDVHANTVKDSYQLANSLIYDKDRSKICNTFNHAYENVLAEAEEEQDVFEEQKQYDMNFLNPHRHKRRVCQSLLVPDKLQLNGKTSSVELLFELQQKRKQIKAVNTMIDNERKLELSNIDSDLSFRGHCNPKSLKA